jgi:hypothetical protein
VPFVAAGSLVTQTHLSYPILVAALAVPAVAGQVSAARRIGDVHAYKRPWAIAVGLAVVLWLQTLIDQLFGWGNVGAVLASPGDTEAAGWTTGLRIVADVIVDRRGYLRPGFATYDPNSTIAGDLRVVLFAAVMAGLAGGAVVAFRTAHRTAAAGLTVGSVAVAAAVVNAAQLPVTQFGLTAANYRWLWPTAAILTMGVVMAANEWVRSPARAATPSIALAAVVAFAALNLPASYQVDRPDVYRDRIDATADITEQLSQFDLDTLDGPVVIDQRQMYFGHPFAYPIAVVLRERGVEYRLDGAQQARRFGESRVSDGTEPYRLVLLHATDALERRGDDDVIAFVDGPDPVALVLETRS